jgi:putative Holliday junction resolvase
MGRIAGIDYGERRIGVAISDPEAVIALSLCTIAVKTTAQAVAAVAAACREVDPLPTLVVVGLPLQLNGRRGGMCAKVEAFVAALRSALGIPVITWDERLTTSQVERLLLEANLTRAKRKNIRDKLAAQIILQNYLDSQSVRPTIHANP